MQSAAGGGHSLHERTREMIEERKTSLAPPVAAHLSNGFSSYSQDDNYRNEEAASPTTALSADPFNVAFHGLNSSRGVNGRDGRKGRDGNAATTGTVIIPVKSKIKPIDYKTDISVAKSSTSNNTRNGSTGLITNQSQMAKMLGRTPTRRKPRKKVKVVIKERLSILFAHDPTTSTTETNNEGAEGSNNTGPVCRVVGSIFLRPSPSPQKGPKNHEKDPSSHLYSFYLTVRDEKSHIEHWDDQRDTERCRNITAGISHALLGSRDQVFAVSLSELDSSIDGGDKKQDVKSVNGEHLSPIISYTCIPRLRPMPMVRFIWKSFLFRFGYCLFRLVHDLNFSLTFLSFCVLTLPIVGQDES
jgi:hypothetical protein